MTRSDPARAYYFIKFYSGNFCTAYSPPPEREKKKDISVYHSDPPFETMPCLSKNDPKIFTLVETVDKEISFPELHVLSGPKHSQIV
jgi:hypothetical protein